MTAITQGTPATGQATYSGGMTTQQSQQPQGTYALIEAELVRAYAKHGREPWGRHEFYAILKEEVDELWDAIKADEPTERVLEEAVQVAAMCVRYMQTGDRYRGPHPRTSRITGFTEEPRTAVCGKDMNVRHPVGQCPEDEPQRMPNHDPLDFVKGEYSGPPSLSCSCPVCQAIPGWSSRHHAS